MLIKSISFKEMASYNEAAKATTGYNNEILVSSNPKYKRSPITSAENPYIQNTSEVSGMAAVLSAAIQCGSKKIKVLDVGGALGSHYSAFRKMVKGNIDVSWNIVETEIQSNYGNQYIKDDSLHFFIDIDDVDENNFDIVLMSGSLQYFEHPNSILENDKILKSKFLIINRLPICQCSTELAYAQFIEYDAGSVSYPGRAFNWNYLKGIIERTHRVSLFWQNPHETHSSDKGTVFTSIGLQATNLNR